MPNSVPEIDEELRRLLNPPRRTTPTLFSDPLPKIYPPSSAIKGPDIIGSPELLEYADYLLNLSPKTKSNVNQIVQGPTKGVLEQLIDSNMRPSRFPYSNLLGTYDTRNRNIAINPILEQLFEDKSESVGTLGHEIAHAAGYGHGRTLDNISGLARMKYEADLINRKGLPKYLEMKK
jgi:hypothetical protein